MINRQRPAPRSTSPQPSRLAAPRYDPLAHAMGMQRVIELVHELEGLKSQWASAIDEANNLTKTIQKGDKGDRGFTGAKGDKGDTGNQGEKGNIGETGPAGKDGKDGITPDTESIKRAVIAVMPFIDQKDEQEPELNMDMFTKMIEEHPALKRVSDSIKSIDARTRQYLHGGGDTVDAGSGISITTNSNGRKTITNTGTAVNYADGETAGGSGTAWTLAHTPTAGSEKIYANGQRLQLTTDYTIVGANITTVNSFALGSLNVDYRY